MAAGNPASAQEFRHDALGDVGSTNLEAMARGEAGDPGNLWITAERQTGGRARRGRNWISERGNLYASLLLIDPAPAALMPSLPLVAAVAAHGAVSRLLAGHQADVAIKWPNDILIERKKVCGILLEAQTLSDGRFAVVIGIGVNIGFSPEDMPYPVAKLADYSASANAAVLFAHLFEIMAEELALWNRGIGVTKTVARWRAAACGINEKITINLTHEKVAGLFAGIDDAGMLKLETEEGTRTFAAGDVFFENKTG